VIFGCKPFFVNVTFFPSFGLDCFIPADVIKCRPLFLPNSHLLAPVHQKKDASSMTLPASTKEKEMYWP